MRVPVLIVGGGPVGLTAAILLSREGVAWLLVRPDGYVGWRSRSITGDPTTILRRALLGMLGLA